MLLCMESGLCCGWLQTLLQLSMAGMISNSVVLYVEAVECKSSTESMWYVGVGCFAAAGQRLSCKWKAVV